MKYNEQVVKRCHRDQMLIIYKDGVDSLGRQCKDCTIVCENCGAVIETGRFVSMSEREIESYFKKNYLSDAYIYTEVPLCPNCGLTLDFTWVKSGSYHRQTKRIARIFLDKEHGRMSIRHEVYAEIYHISGKKVEVPRQTETVVFHENGNTYMSGHLGKHRYIWNVTYRSDLYGECITQEALGAFKELHADMPLDRLSAKDLGPLHKLCPKYKDQVEWITDAPNIGRWKSYFTAECFNTLKGYLNKADTLSFFKEQGYPKKQVNKITSYNEALCYDIAHYFADFPEQVCTVAAYFYEILTWRHDLGEFLSEYVPCLMDLKKILDPEDVRDVIRTSYDTGKYLMAVQCELHTIAQSPELTELLRSAVIEKGTINCLFLARRIEKITRVSLKPYPNAKGWNFLEEDGVRILRNQYELQKMGSDLHICVGSHSEYHEMCLEGYGCILEFTLKNKVHCAEVYETCYGDYQLNQFRGRFNDVTDDKEIRAFVEEYAERHKLRLPRHFWDAMPYYHAVPPVGYVDHEDPFDLIDVEPLDID